MTRADTENIAHTHRPSCMHSSAYMVAGGFGVARNILSLIWFLCSQQRHFACSRALTYTHTEKPKCNQSNSQSILKMFRAKWCPTNKMNANNNGEPLSTQRKQWENGFALVHHYWIKRHAHVCMCAAPEYVSDVHSGLFLVLHRPFILFTSIDVRVAFSSRQHLPSFCSLVLFWFHTILRTRLYAANTHINRAHVPCPATKSHPSSM